MEYLKTIRVVFVFIQASIVFIHAEESTYCDRCHAEPTACRRVSGTFAITVMSKGYNPVVSIPVGACFLNVTEKGASRNYLALKSERSGYILNGMWKMNSPGDYNGVGTVFHYARADESCPGDCIYSKGPIRDDLVVQLLYHDVSPGVDYSYVIPYYFDPASLGKENTVEQSKLSDHQKDAFVSSTSQKQSTASTKAPGSGGLHGENGVASGHPGERSALRDSKTHYSEAGLQADVAHHKPSSYRRRTGSRTERRRNSRRRRPIFSSDFKRPNSKRDDRYRRPYPGRQSLTGTSYSRYVGSSDIQARPDTSAALDPAANLIETDSRPTPTGVANEVSIQGADGYVWRSSGYTACSTTCGGGIKQPILECTDVKTGGSVATAFCRDQIKPEMDEVACSTEPCIPNWETGEWSTCSSTCGRGQQIRLVLCQQRISPTNILNLTADDCLENKPADTRPCIRSSCYNWVTSAWSDCSVLCGTGIRTRQVQCQNEEGKVNDSLCNLPKPRSSRSCDLGSCARNWYYSDWNNMCSTDCGSGKISRKVHCITDSGQVLPDDQCDTDIKPSEEKPCSQNIQCGGKWFTGPWSQCSVSCGEGLRQRSVVCIQKQQDGSMQALESSQCPQPTKPLTEEICSQEHCGTLWYMTDWSKCSVTCGGGVKHRHVQCLNSAMEHSTSCLEADQPVDRTPCSTDRCWTSPKPTNTGCIDKYPNCAVVVQTRLCRYPYYQRNCCRACSGRT